ncbi:MAG: amidohydrolase [Acidobacteriaceae bacterium]
MNVKALFLLCSVISPSLRLNAAQSADVILAHGRIYTGVLRDGKPEIVSAVAIREGKIFAAGTDQEIAKYQSKNSEIIELAGKFAMPGFNDAHTHLAEAGQGKLEVDLTGSKSLADMLARIDAANKSAEPGQWLLGRGWDHTLWSRVVLPTRYDLDKVTAGHPAIFNRIDGHIAVANTAALESAGVSKLSADPQGGKFDHGSDGDLTGIVRETARAAIQQKIPRPTASLRRRALELALRDAASWGITTAQDNSDWEDFEVLELLEQEQKLPIRVTEWLHFNDSIDVLKRQHSHHSATDSMLHFGMLKGFMDGSLGSGTAALLAPYADDAKSQGIPYYKQDELNSMARDRVAAGFQLGFHAIGDAGVRTALNAFQFAREQTGKQDADLRFRIEHSQVVAPEDFARYKQIGVIASMQPNHLLTDMNWAQGRLGTERAKHSYAWREFLDNGVPLAFGTDYPVEPITPFRGIYAAVTRRNEAANKTYPGDQTISILQAISAYTTGSAYAEFAEKHKGTLEPGKYADVVVLDRDITTVAARDILATRVLRTIVAGKTVYEAPAH